MLRHTKNIDLLGHQEHLVFRAKGHFDRSSVPDNLRNQLTKQPINYTGQMTSYTN